MSKLTDDEKLKLRGMFQDFNKISSEALEQIDNVTKEEIDENSDSRN